MSAENEFVRVQVNTVTGSLVSLTNKATQTKVNVTSSLLYYQAYGKQGDSCSSGAYLFHPNTSAVHNLPAISGHNCLKTPLLASCVFQFGTWGSLQYKLRAWDHSVVVEWTKTWYTDSNGLEFVKRVRDYRETWNLTLHNEEEKVAANYVPITIATVGPLAPATEQLRAEMSRRYLNPLVALSAHNASLTPPTSSWAPRLPFNVGLISLEVVNGHTIRLRLTHLFAIHEHPEWSKDATVDLLVLLGPQWSVDGVHVTELNLSGNRVVGPIQGTTVTLQPMHVREFEVTTKKAKAATVYDGQVTNLADAGNDNDDDDVEGDF
ncbi:hypothetical protein DYB28_011341 [Aphanomyces astaci]|uniref:Glycosyl hydrolase family 38 C-terminal domain-containing protein n=2 Tax=Aphanomyces astaci TaxID=112090 RepID=A0A9X8E841_APHAT|nr:hypothetical protein DYB28_011341 [Aphanomyces astaci]